MNDDLLLEIMKNDELVTEIKRSVLNHVTRRNAIFELQTKRGDKIKKQEAYNKKTEQAIQKLDHEIYRIEREENNLCQIIDEYGDPIEEAPHFTTECIELLVQFVEEFQQKEMDSTK